MAHRKSSASQYSLHPQNARSTSKGEASSGTSASSPTVFPPQGFYHSNASPPTLVKEPAPQGRPKYSLTKPPGSASTATTAEANPNTELSPADLFRKTLQTKEKRQAELLSSRETGKRKKTRFTLAKSQPVSAASPSDDAPAFFPPHGSEDAGAEILGAPSPGIGHDSRPIINSSQRREAPKPSLPVPITRFMDAPAPQMEVNGADINLPAAVVSSSRSSSNKVMGIHQTPRKHVPAPGARFDRGKSIARTESIEVTEKASHRSRDRSGTSAQPITTVDAKQILVETDAYSKQSKASRDSYQKASPSAGEMDIKPRHQARTKRAQSISINQTTTATPLLDKYMSSRHSTTKKETPPERPTVTVKLAARSAAGQRTLTSDALPAHNATSHLEDDSSFGSNHDGMTSTTATGSSLMWWLCHSIMRCTVFTAAVLIFLLLLLKYFLPFLITEVVNALVFDVAGSVMASTGKIISRAASNINGTMAACFTSLGLFPTFISSLVYASHSMLRDSTKTADNPGQAFQTAVPFLLPHHSTALTAHENILSDITAFADPLSGHGTTQYRGKLELAMKEAGFNAFSWSQYQVMLFQHGYNMIWPVRQRIEDDKAWLQGKIEDLESLRSGFAEEESDEHDGEVQRVEGAVREALEEWQRRQKLYCGPDC